MSVTTITRKYLREHPNSIFVFGDNLLRTGLGGAAALRHEPNTYGVITKRYPSNDDQAFFKPDEEFEEIFLVEIHDLIKIIETNPDKIYLISPLGSGLANRYNIWEKIIQPKLMELSRYSNVKLLFN